MRFAKAMAVLACVPLLTAAAEPIHLQPTSKWVVDYADDSCRLLRTFGTPEDPSLLLMEKIAPNGSMSMLVTSRSLRTSLGARDFTARFLPHQQVKALDGLAATTDGKDRKPAVLWSYVTFDETYGPKDPLPDKLKALIANAKIMKKGERPPPRDPALRKVDELEALTRASKVTGIEISRRGSRTVILDTGSMGAVVNMMKKCAENQLTNWGIDPKVNEQIALPVDPIDPMAWFSTSDYPPDSLSKALESQLSVRVLVDAKGKITKCTPVTRVSATDFGIKVCDVMQRRAKFRPAELADGTKAPSYYIQRINFRLP